MERTRGSSSSRSGSGVGSTLLVVLVAGLLLLFGGYLSLLSFRVSNVTTTTTTTTTTPHQYSGQPSSVANNNDNNETLQSTLTRVDIEARLREMEEELLFKKQFLDESRGREFYSTKDEDLLCRRRASMSECLDVESVDPTNQTCVWCSSLSLCVSGNQVSGPRDYDKYCPYWCGNGEPLSLMIVEWYYFHL